MESSNSDVNSLYGWEFDLATTLTEEIFSIMLRKIFLFQPINPQEYCFHLLTAWDGESVDSFQNLKLAPIAVEEDNPLTPENMDKIGLDSFLNDIILEIASRIKTLLPKDAPLQTPNILHKFVSMKALHKVLVQEILPELLKKHHITITSASEAVSSNQDESVVNPHLYSKEIEYGTPVATNPSQAVSPQTMVQSQFHFPLSAPAKLTQIDPFDRADSDDENIDPDDLEEQQAAAERREAKRRRMRRIGRTSDDEEDGFIEGEDVMEDIRDVGTFAAGSSGGKNELRIKEEEDAERARAMRQQFGENSIRESGEYGAS